jgi:hypothetical protein
MEWLPLRGCKVLPPHVFCSRFERGEIPQKRRGFECLKILTRQRNARPIFQAIAFDGIRRLGGSFQMVTAIPGCEIDYLEFAIFRNRRSWRLSERGSSDERRDRIQDDETTQAMHQGQPM